ncbi:PAC motif-containing family protein [Dorcoceras hygrometricum]|uniref:PAC motif-containing family protein n=1 Tax=Dorcoceras hygrometricum TaxID=472368 RepID=A0A2Z6ZVB3_9LAMI|nr:PAC motif-containing family protein [Dorcoceras hygrometricum]
MRERARMAAPGRQSSSAAVPHERRMACCPSRKDVAPLEACWSTGCERRRAAAAVHHTLSLGGASRESLRIAAGPPCDMNAAVDGRPLQAAGVGVRWRRWSTLRARRCAALRFARWCARCHRVFVVAAAPSPAAAPPPLWRVSGDVVTAGLISSRVWFGPVPGSQ